MVSVRKRITGIFDSENKTYQAGSIYDEKGLAPTLTSASGGNIQPHILVQEGTKTGVVRQLLYENQLRESNIRQLIQETYKLLSEESMSKFQHFKRATRTFGDLSKREIKEIIRNGRSYGFDWFSER